MRHNCLSVDDGSREEIVENVRSLNLKGIRGIRIKKWKCFVLIQPEFGRQISKKIRDSGIIDRFFTKPGFGKRGEKQGKNEDQPDFDLPFIFAWSAEKGLFPPAAF